MPKKVIPGLVIIAMVIGATPALAFNDADNPAIQINSTISATPTLKSGGGEFYPVINTLKIVGNLDLSNVTLTLGEGTDLEIDTSTAANLINNKLKYGDEVTLMSVHYGLFTPVAVVLQGPMNVGHINFGNGSVTLDASDKSILYAMAEEMKATNLTAAYLVGRTDKLGGDADPILGVIFQQD